MPIGVVTGMQETVIGLHYGEVQSDRLFILLTLHVHAIDLNILIFQSH